MELAYSLSPSAMHGFVMGLMDASRGFGAFVGAALLMTINAISLEVSNEPWYPELHDAYGKGPVDFRHLGHADYYFFTLAILMAVNTLTLFIVIWRYKYRRDLEPSLSPIWPVSAPSSPAGDADHSFDSRQSSSHPPESSSNK